jgi:hypothetical protein
MLDGPGKGTSSTRWRSSTASSFDELAEFLSPSAYRYFDRRRRGRGALRRARFCEARVARVIEKADDAPIADFNGAIASARRQRGA